MPTDEWDDFGDPVTFSILPFSVKPKKLEKYNSILQATGQIVMKFAVDVHGPQWMNSYVWGGPTSLPVPPSCHILTFMLESSITGTE